MTACLVVKAPDRFVAVADGRLSVGANTVSFDTTKKLIRFVPRYNLPKVSVGRFDHSVEYKEREWLLAYAGTYALCAEIIKSFISVVDGGLYLDRDRFGVPFLNNEFDFDAHYDSSYNFNNNEILKFTATDIMREMKTSVEMLSNEWRKNIEVIPDCDFILLGVDAETKIYRCFNIYVDKNVAHGQKMKAICHEISDGDIVGIGSGCVISNIHSDDALISGVTSEWSGAETYLHASAEGIWTSQEVANRFVSAIRNSPDAAVGGTLMTVSGKNYGSWILSEV